VADFNEVDPPPPAPVPTTKKKVTLYFNASMLGETQHEAIRQDRSISWIIQAAWRRARDEVRRLPGADPERGGPTERGGPETPPHEPPATERGGPRTAPNEPPTGSS
jgi:uncharacterized small protein (TIGR04563 family)